MPRNNVARLWILVGQVGQVVWEPGSDLWLGCFHACARATGSEIILCNNMLIAGMKDWLDDLGELALGAWSLEGQVVAGGRGGGEGRLGEARGGYGFIHLAGGRWLAAAKDERAATPQ